MIIVQGSYKAVLFLQLPLILKTIFMKTYLNVCEVIVDLHERGYTDDFELNGNGLPCVRKGFVLHHKGFSITECHHFLGVKGSELVVFGVVSESTMIKGILIIHCEDGAINCRRMIERKIDEFSSFVTSPYDKTNESWSFS
jgi:hypothetical protein